MVARFIFVFLALFSLDLTAWAQTRTAAPRPVVARGPLPAEEQAVVDIFRTASPSVTHITTLERVVNFWTRNVREVPKGTGSGFIWDEEGHIVTNFHVIAGARIIQVRLSDQRAVTAELVGASPDHDLAVLRARLAGPRPRPLPLGSSGDLVVGQKVLAIGNPFGFDHSLSTGVISALDRSIDGEGGRTLHRVIQIDAAINPGNSGGPLLDSAGRLIGVNSAIFSPSGANAGIGFAVPVDTVNRVVPEIIAYGHYRRPNAGFTVIDQVSRAVAGALGVKGAVILDIAPNAPVAQAGIRGARVGRDGNVVPGDILQAIDGLPVESASQIERALDGKRPGEQVVFRLWRDGKVIDVPVALAGERG